MKKSASVGWLVIYNGLSWAKVKVFGVTEAEPLGDYPKEFLPHTYMVLTGNGYILKKSSVVRNLPKPQHLDSLPKASRCYNDIPIHEADAALKVMTSYLGTEDQSWRLPLFTDILVDGSLVPTEMPEKIPHYSATHTDEIVFLRETVEWLANAVASLRTLCPVNTPENLRAGNFRIGSRYLTRGGKVVLVVRYGLAACVAGDDGIWRYDRAYATDTGRCTGSEFDGVDDLMPGAVTKEGVVLE